MKYPQLGDPIYYVEQNNLTITKYGISSLEGELSLASSVSQFTSITLGFGRQWDKKVQIWGNKMGFKGTWELCLFFTEEEAKERIKDLKEKKIERLQKEIEKLKL